MGKLLISPICSYEVYALGRRKLQELARATVS